MPHDGKARMVVPKSASVMVICVVELELGSFEVGVARLSINTCCPLKSDFSILFKSGVDHCVVFELELERREELRPYHLFILHGPTVDFLKVHLPFLKVHYPLVLGRID